MDDTSNPDQQTPNPPQPPFLQPHVHSQLLPHHRYGGRRIGAHSLPPPDSSPDEQTTYTSSNDAHSRPATTSRSENKNTAESKDTDAACTPYDPAIQDIDTIANILDTVLVPDLTPEIIEMARYWTHESAERNNQMTVSQVTSGRTYIRTKPLSVGLKDTKETEVTKGKGLLRLIVLTLRSHDQGWSDTPDLHHTYEASHTWFKVVLKRPRSVKGNTSGAGHAESANEQQPEDASTEEPAVKGDDSPKEEEYDEVASKILFPNVHGHPYDTVHTITWSMDPSDTSIIAKYHAHVDRSGNRTPDPVLDDYTEEEKIEIVEFLRQIRDGDRLEIQVFAQYPGWINHVAGVRIDVYCAGM